MRTRAGPDISASGRYVTYKRLRLTGLATVVSRPALRPANGEDETPRRSRLGIGEYAEGLYQAPVSASGRFLAYPVIDGLSRDGDRGGEAKAIHLDAKTGRRLQASVSPDGRSLIASDAAISGDGRIVAWEGPASRVNIAQSEVWVRDVRRPRGRLVSLPRLGSRRRADDRSEGPALSRDGRWLAYVSDANNLSRVDDNDDHNVFPVKIR